MVEAELEKTFFEYSKHRNVEEFVLKLNFCTQIEKNHNSISIKDHSQDTA